MVAARPTPTDRRSPPRAWLAAAGLALLVVGCVPPVATLARRTEVVNAAQFALFALAVPALVTLGAPWRLAGGLRVGSRPRGALVGWVALCAEVVAVCVWRTPAAVRALQGTHTLVVLEAASLLVVGVALWTALVDSPPLAALSPPLPLVLAAIAMWTVWIVAYVFGMAHGQGYPGFGHTAGSGLSAAADRQLATVVLFVAAAVAYLPVVFRGLFMWLADEERRGAAETARRRSTASGGVTREDVHPAR